MGYLAGCEEVMELSVILIIGGVATVAGLAWAMFKAVPVTVVLPFWMGILVGWMFHPAVWWVFPTPIRAWRYLSMLASMESGWVTTIVGDTNLPQSSYGLLQFQEGNWQALNGLPDTSVSGYDNPYRQGYTGIAYVNDALINYPGWQLWLRLPVIAPPAFRVLWRRGAATSPWSGDDLGTYLGQEVVGAEYASPWMWYLVFGLITWPLSALAFVSVLVALGLAQFVKGKLKVRK